MAGVTTETVGENDDGMRLDRWMRERFPGLQFGRLQKLLRSGQIRVDGARVKTSTRLATGQAIRLPPLDAEKAPPIEPAPGGSADADALRAFLLHEDDKVLVFNKPAGLAVQGGSGLSRHVDGMLEAFRDRKGQKPRLVHRLDRETSGVLVVARTRAAAQALAESFRARSTRKIYWALTKGVPRERQGRISTWLTKDSGPDGDFMQVHRERTADAVHAVTAYSVIDQAGQNVAWQTLRPITGRTHQLRVHMAHLGTPIVGDPKYFNIMNWELPGGMQNRMHLHARRIVVPHPAGGTLDVTAPLPAHMVQTWNLLGFDIDAATDSESGEGEGA